MIVTTVIVWGLLAILAGTFLICVLTVLTQRWHGPMSLDSDMLGVQKIHRSPVPRIGGMGIIVGLLMGVFVGYLMGGQTYPTAVQLLIAAIPVFLAGTLEDLTKRVSIRARLYAAFFSAALGIATAGTQLTRLDTPMLDAWMSFAPFAMVFTCFAVGGMTHAINIIDGLNGLASGTVLLMLAGLSSMAWQTNDILVLKLCLWGIAAMLGFLMLNFPFGRIFLGDGGAYLAGFWVAECSVLLLMRNPEVSTWAVLLCCAYPVWETVFSMYRRYIVNHVSSGQADSSHLHHHIYRQVSRSTQYRNLPSWVHHGLVTAVIWSIVAACQFYANHFQYNSNAAALGLLLFVLAYLQVYRTAPVEVSSGEVTRRTNLNKSAQI